MRCHCLRRRSLRRRRSRRRSLCRRNLPRRRSRRRRNLTPGHLSMHRLSLIRYLLDLILLVHLDRRVNRVLPVLVISELCSTKMHVIISLLKPSPLLAHLLALSNFMSAICPMLMRL